MPPSTARRTAPVPALAAAALACVLTAPSAQATSPEPRPPVVASAAVVPAAQPVEQPREDHVESAGQQRPVPGSEAPENATAGGDTSGDEARGALGDLIADPERGPLVAVGTAVLGLLGVFVAGLSRRPGPAD